MHHRKTTRAIDLLPLQIVLCGLCCQSLSLQSMHCHYATSFAVVWYRDASAVSALYRKASRAYLVRLGITVSRNEDREGTHRDNYPP